MAATETAFLTTVLTLGGAAAIGFVLYKLISKSGETESATDHGRNWLAWVVFFASIAFLPTFIRDSDPNSFAKWVLAIVFYGFIAFVVGWVYGKLFGRKNRTPE